MRSVPLWIFALSFLLWITITLTYGANLKKALDNNEDQKIVVKISSIGTTISEILQEFYIRTFNKDFWLATNTESESFDYSLFHEIKNDSGYEIDGLLIRYDEAKIEKGWRLLAGVFKINGETEQATIIISPDMIIVKVLILDEIPMEGKRVKSKYRKFIHGIDFVKDGSFVFLLDRGNSLQRFDTCGKRIWSVPARKFHHTLTINEDTHTFWAFSGQHEFSQLNIDDGSILKTISIDEIIAANPLLGILDIRRKIADDTLNNTRNTKEKWLYDPFHFNDIDPLPASLVHKFNGMQAGDLLISSRSLNLVFVLDPDTLKIKWWRAGATQRQHDPDWLPNGEISILSNRSSRDYSEITAINPDTYQRRTLYSGQAHDFYTRTRGRHQILDSGMLIVTSSEQGRVFEINPDGDMVLEILNLKPPGNNKTTPDKHFLIADMLWRPTDSAGLGDPCPQEP